MINLGNAVYRDGAGPASGRGHAALVYKFYGSCTRANLMNDDRFGIVEMPGINHGVETNLLSSITAAASLDAWGCYTNTADINYVARLKILKWAYYLAQQGDAIDYEFNDALLPEPWSDALNTIGSLRCDGLVEVCYEANGINVWGKSGNPNHFDIRNDAYQVEHNIFKLTNWADTLQPATQCGHVTPVDAVTTFVAQNLCTLMGSTGGN